MIQITITSSKEFPEQEELIKSLKATVEDVVSEGLWLKDITDITFKVEIK